MTRLLLLFISVTFIACSQDQSHQEDHHDDKELLKGTPVCTESEPLICLNKISRNQIKDKDSYIYMDSFNDPGFPSQLDPYQYMAPEYFLDLTQIDPDHYLTPFFQVHEVMSWWKGDYGLFSSYVLKQITKMRDQLKSKLIVNSAYRSPAYNKKVGGATWSRHTFGDAVDLKASAADRNKIENLCKQLGASYTQLYESHVHCDWRNTELDSYFFPPGLRPKNNPVDDSTFEKNIQILTTIKNNKLYIESQYPETEDEHHKLLHVWTIKTPTHTTMILEGAQVVFNLKTTGRYQIDLQLGGRYFSTQEVQYQK